MKYASSQIRLKTLVPIQAVLSPVSTYKGDYKKKKKINLYKYRTNNSYLFLIQKKVVSVPTIICDIQLSHKSLIPLKNVSFSKKYFN